MPRRDGFDTNEEMLMDFNAMSREVFIAGYEHAMQHKVPSAYEDKPLTAFGLVVRRVAGVEGDNPDTVSEESLDVGVAHPRLLEAQMWDSFIVRKYPEDAKQHRLDVVRGAAALCLNDNLIMRSAVPVEAIDAEWVLRYAVGNSRHVSTYKDKPAKASLAAAKFFATDALKYVQSSEFAKPPKVRFIEQILDPISAQQANPNNLSHSFKLAYEPGLPLNGHESEGYLTGYATEMQARAIRSKATLDRMVDLGLTGPGLEIRVAAHELYQSSYDRAAKLLADRR